MSSFNEPAGAHQTEGRRAMSLAYKVEELLALRDSVSESAVSIDKFADEDAVKEHVLRPSASVTLIVEKYRHPVATTPSVAPPLSLKKPSPSPSIKRGKAERLLKEHGSPPGMRVTAGGRIVPSDLPPLGISRFGTNGFRPPALRGFTPSNDMSQSLSDLNNNNNAHNPPQSVEVINGQPVLRLGDRLYALPAIDPSPNLPPVMPSLLSAPSVSNASPLLSIPNGYPNMPLPLQKKGSHASLSQASLLGASITELRLRQATKKQELRTVEQTEVLQASQQTEEWRAGIIQKKKTLILELDNLRKQINIAECNASRGSSGSAPSIGPSTGNGAAPAFQPAFVSQYQQPVVQPLFSTIGLPGNMPAANQYNPLMMFPPYISSDIPPADISQFNRDARVFVPHENTINGPQYSNGLSPNVMPPQSPNSASRRSHAIEIKPPHDDKKKAPGQTSSLDPKSPTYEPGMKINALRPVNNDFASPPIPSPMWRSQDKSSIRSNTHERALSQKPSLSSIDTQDFFPTNTHEHSSTRIAPNKLMPSNQPSRENMAVPLTLGETWPVGPWNSQAPVEPKTEQSIQGDSFKSSLWGNELRGKPQEYRTVSEYLLSSGLPRTDPEVMREHEAAVPSVRKADTQFSSFSVNEAWRVMDTRRVSHQPSTYQEGFQAGFEHAGLPNNPEVIHGYLNGLQMSLHETSSLSPSPPKVASASIDSRGHSHAQLTGGMLRDSAINMHFSQCEATSAKSENVRSAKVSNGHSPSSRGIAYGPPGIVLEQAAKIGNEKAHNVRIRHFPMAVDKGTNYVTDRYGYSYQRADAPAADNDILKHRPTHLANIDATYQATGYPRQYSGNASTRVSGSPTGMQRSYPTAKALGAVERDSSSSRRVNRQQVSNLDGAMDDLVDLTTDLGLEETQDIATNVPVASDVPAAPNANIVETETGASCFRSSSSKGKAKAPASPSKTAPGNGKETTGSSPVKPSGSPKKSGEHSPAKAKLESVTNKFRRTRKDDTRIPSPEDKQRRVLKWQKRFQVMKQKETKEIAEYMRNNPRDDSGGDPRNDFGSDVCNASAGDARNDSASDSRNKPLANLEFK